MSKRTPVDHPLEEAFGIELGSTFNNLPAEQDDLMAVPAQQVEKPYQDDDEDKEINTNIAEIYEAAMVAFDQQNNLCEVVEPRYAARNAEVANQYLNTALQAMALKARVKNDKRKSGQFIPYGNQGVTNNNLVVASREDILKMLDQKKDE